jgi:hypothetical protein
MHFLVNENIPGSVIRDQNEGAPTHSLAGIRRGLM